MDIAAISEASTASTADTRSTSPIPNRSAPTESDTTRMNDSARMGTPDTGQAISFCAINVEPHLKDRVFVLG